MKKLIPMVVLSLISQTTFANREFLGNISPSSQTSTVSTNTNTQVEVTSVPRPEEFDVQFKESDLTEKSWMKEFPYVVVVTKTEKGVKIPETVRIYKDGKIVTFEEIKAELQIVQKNEQLELNDLINQYNESNSRYQKDALKTEIELMQKRIADRPMLLKQLVSVDEKGNTRYIRENGVFKVSTGRDQFEEKGEHHSNHDSWSVTPSGYFTPKSFNKKHRSESYSPSMCKNWFGKAFGIECTYMENAIFFNGPIALHRAIPGTELELGRKASGGCVRLPGAIADFLYSSIVKTKLEFGRYPVVAKDGSLIDPSTIVNKRPLDAYGALIIVQNIKATAVQQ